MTQTNRGYQPQLGDLLFQDVAAGALGEAIQAVTHGWCGARFTHVGVVSAVVGQAGGVSQSTAPRPTEAWVLESYDRGVVEVPLAYLLRRSADAAGRPRVLVTRDLALDSAVIERALHRGRRLIGAAYDWDFDLESGNYYCASLIHAMFIDAVDGAPLFAPEPMTFRDPQTDAPFPGWAAHFANRGRAIPEGRPGLNPAAMSRNPRLTPIARLGEIRGLVVSEHLEPAVRKP